MQVILLAAGRGMRMMPLTLDCPKPLLYYGKYRLIEYNLFNLAKSGFKKVLINVSYRSQDFLPILGYGEKYNIEIEYIFEPLPGFETGGTVINALEHFNHEPFLMLSSDIYHNYELTQLKTLKPKFAHLVLVPPDKHNFKGDFNLKNNEITGPGPYSYANIGVFNPAIFNNWPKKCRIPLKQILSPIVANKEQTITGSVFATKYYWKNLSRPEDLV